MNFGPHVEEAAGKAEKMAGLLGRIMPNLRGAQSTRRKLFSSVVHSKLLYGAAVWMEALKIKKNIEVLTRVQRRVLLRIASGYRTISAVALQVITGVLPVELQVRKQEILRRRPEAKQEVTET
jgi:ribose 1,5-bisphosphokinase PhnN